jgi:8-oxo-dGTP diphosphatase
MITCTFENGKSTSLRHVVVHAIVEQDGKFLLVKRAPDLLEGGKWSLPSGFLDRDETTEQATLRELLEETGYEGSNPALFRIVTNPDRPHEDRQNVSFVYIVTPGNKVGERDNESTEVAWVAAADLPPFADMAFDHGQSLELYLKWKTTTHALPLQK